MHNLLKKRWIVLSLIIIVLIALVISGYFLFSFAKQCSTQECFDKALVKCQKTFFIKDSPETVMQYNILGKSSEMCKVDVKLIQIKKGSLDLGVLEGKSMICYIPNNLIIAPESDIKNCHGILKEEMQNIIITRMHSQIVENLGKINEETLGIL